MVSRTLTKVYESSLRTELLRLIDKVITRRLGRVYTNPRNKADIQNLCVIQATRVRYAGPNPLWADDLMIGQLLRGLWALKIPLELRIIRSIEGGDPVLVMDGAGDSDTLGQERVIANVGYVDQRHYVSTIPIPGISRTAGLNSGSASQRKDTVGEEQPVNRDANEEGAMGASTMQSTGSPLGPRDGLSWSKVQCQLCSSPHDETKLILCDKCDAGYHTNCLDPQMSQIPQGEWLCPLCDSTTQASSSCRICNKGNNLRNCSGCRRPFHTICVRGKGLAAGDSWQQRAQCPECATEANKTRLRLTASQRSYAAPECTAEDKCTECMKAGRRWSAPCQSCVYANQSFHRCRIQFQHDDPEGTNTSSVESDRQNMGKDSRDREDHESLKSYERDDDGNDTSSDQGDDELVREDNREGGQRSGKSRQDVSEPEITGEVGQRVKPKRSRRQSRRREGAGTERRGS